MSDSFVTPRPVAHWAPLSMGFRRQESLSGLPFPSPEDHPNSGMEPVSPALEGGSPLLPEDAREAPGSEPRTHVGTRQPATLPVGSLFVPSQQYLS